MSNEAAPSRSLIHPAAWQDAKTVLDVTLRAHKQLHCDLVEVGKLAAAFGVEIDVAAAIRSQASVSDLLIELRDELCLK